MRVKTAVKTKELHLRLAGATLIQALQIHQAAHIDLVEATRAAPNTGNSLQKTIELQLCTLAGATLAQAPTSCKAEHRIATDALAWKQLRHLQTWQRFCKNNMIEVVCSRHKLIPRTHNCKLRTLVKEATTPPNIQKIIAKTTQLQSRALVESTLPQALQIQKTNHVIATWVLLWRQRRHLKTHTIQDKRS